MSPTLPHIGLARRVLSGGRAELDGDDQPGRRQRTATGTRPSDLDPYDWYLSAYRSAYFDVAAAVREMPTARHRAAFSLGLEDGRNGSSAPRSRWQMTATLEHVVA